ncbi:MAG: hypothetical protein KatS3mg035_1732 [Bacteroidia bacterium]|nr:MAG: hypothetical protein KatS3mg035_1732 [Bacteroidia bacterium]
MKNAFLKAIFKRFNDKEGKHQGNYQIRLI